MTFSPEKEKSSNQRDKEDDIEPVLAPTTSSFTVTRKTEANDAIMNNNNNTLTTGNLRASLESLHKLN